MRNPDAESASLAEWRVERPLMQFGGTAIMRSTDVPPGTPRIFQSDGGAATTRPADLGTLSAAGSSSTSMILTTPNQPTPIPLGATAMPTPASATAPVSIKQGGWVRKTEFEAAMMGAGGFVGGVITDGKAAAIGLGGAIGVVYARRKWGKNGSD